MNALVIAIGVTACLAAYFYVGWRLMRWDMPALWKRAARSYSTNSQANSGAALTLLFWPLRLPFLIAMDTAANFDPKRIEAELRESEKRIRELERELEIGRRS